jgi:hypothetical protein
MTDRLWDALLATAQELDIARESVATGGSTTTLVDTVFRLEPDDFWNQGTIWYEDADGAQSYNNYCTRINDFYQTTKTLTFAVQTEAPEAGDRYIVADARYPMDLLWATINSVLRRAPIIALDETLTIASNQTEYTLPTAIYRGNLRYVYYQVDTDDSNDNRWKRIDDWRLEDGDTGSADTLILLQQYSSGHALQLHYITHHPPLTTIAANLNENINLRGLAVRAAVRCVRQRMQRQKKDLWAAEIMNDLISTREEIPLVRRTYPVIPRLPYIERRDNS